MSRRARRNSSARDSPSTSRPLNRTSPDVGSTSRRMQRPVVVFPLPDSPTRPNVSPGSTSKLTSSTARTTPGRPHRPRPRGNSFTSVRTVEQGHVRLMALGSRLMPAPLASVFWHSGFWIVPASRSTAPRGRRPARSTSGARCPHSAMPRGTAARRRSRAGSSASGGTVPSIAFRRRPARPARNRGQQGLRVRVRRRAEHVPHRPLLDDPAGIHDGHAVGASRR